jgi:hypothetical protein
LHFQLLLPHKEVKITAFFCRLLFVQKYEIKGTPHLLSKQHDQREVKKLGAAYESVIRCLMFTSLLGLSNMFIWAARIRGGGSLMKSGDASYPAFFPRTIREYFRAVFNKKNHSFS